MKNAKLSDIARSLRITLWAKDLYKKGGEIYLVGGIVRDAFIGKESKDIDLVVENIDLIQIKEALEKYGFVKENNIGDSFNVLKFKPKGWKGEDIDVATPRKDIKIGSGHKGFLSLPVKKIKEDLKRRDFTINSIAFNILSEKILDPFNGLKDLKKGVIKATNKKSFTEDPLRLMRAIQFAARFEFHIDNETMRMMKNHSAGIKEIKGERILDELKKITGKGGNIQFALELLTESGLDSMLLGGILSEEVVKSWDDLSFFYVLSNAASPNPDRFYRERLKGDREMAKELEVLHRLIKMDVDSIDEEELRYQTFLAFKRAPSVSRADILPYKIHGVFSKMKGGLIPSKDSDIDLDGKEIEEILNINGPEIGMIKEMVHRGSLMNRVDWKDKKALIKFIRSYGKTSFL